MTGEAPSTLGRYELITKLGQGGMAEVHLALQRGPAGFEKLVVVKLVHQRLVAQKTFADMLLDEARIAALVKHPNVVDIYDLGESGGCYFIAMEYLEGEPLINLLRAGREGRRLDALSTVRLIADTAEGLDAAHELRSLAGDPMELVHHDVSLGNIVVLYNGQVKLVDFGVAKASQSAAPSTHVHGKLGYMAPEKLRGRSGDRRCDIWSLGVVLWEALTLKRLFRGGDEAETIRQVLKQPVPSPSTISPDVPPELDAIVMRAIERKPERRYARANQLAEDLEEVLRVRGYGGRNDVIARYMQGTFAGHIVARKQLLHDVASKGRPSLDVLEELFAEPEIAEPAVITDSPPRRDSRNIRPTGEFSVRFRSPTAEVASLGVATESARDSATRAEVIRQRPISKHMLAEGTGRSETEQLFAEATPIGEEPMATARGSDRIATLQVVRTDGHDTDVAIARSTDDGEPEIAIETAAEPEATWPPGTATAVATRAVWPYLVGAAVVTGAAISALLMLQ